MIDCVFDLWWWWFFEDLIEVWMEQEKLWEREVFM